MLNKYDQINFYKTLLAQNQEKVSEREDSFNYQIRITTFALYKIFIYSIFDKIFDGKEIKIYLS